MRGPCSAFRRHRATTEAERLESQTLINLARVGWGRDNPAFRQVFTNLFIPDGTPEQHPWWNELERLTVSPENAARTLEAFYNLDVSALAVQVRVPTLVMHLRGDARVPFDEGRQLAAMIPGARFVPLESGNHVLLENEAAWPVFKAEVRDFLGTAPAPAAHTAHGVSDALAEPALTAAERDVLRLVAQGLDNGAIARQLQKSEKTVRNQVSSIFDKLGVRTRAEAIVHVRDCDPRPWPGASVAPTLLAWQCISFFTLTIDLYRMGIIMPAPAPATGEIVVARLLALGEQLRAQRKRLGVSATTAAEAAGMSRVTLHRIERGEPSVTMGAWLNAAAALGLALGVVDPQPPPPRRSQAAGVPTRIRLADYPQLERLAWQFQGASDVTPGEALSLYERNWRHIEQDALAPHERALIQQLATSLGGSRLLV